MAESVQLERNIFGAGRFEIHIHPDKAGASELMRRGNIIIINSDGGKSGIVRGFSVSEGSRAAKFVIYGETGAGLFKQRLVVPPTNAQVPGSLGWDRISGDGESVLRHYVERNAVQPFDAKRAFPGLCLSENLHRGKEFPWQARYSVLLDELAAISGYCGLGFEVRADLPGRRWVFDVIPGTDRSGGQTERSPVSFNMEYQNVDSYEYSENYGNFRNVGYAGGTGGNENRLVYVLGAQNAGLERFEIFLDCANAANVTELQYYANQKLSERKEQKSVEVTALPKVFLFERDFFLGDLVELYISRIGLTLPSRLTSVREIWERKTGYRAELRFGDKLPTIFSILTKKDVVI